MIEMVELVQAGRTSCIEAILTESGFVGTKETDVFYESLAHHRTVAYLFQLQLCVSTLSRMCVSVRRRVSSVASPAFD
jgi:hypothetical protein